LVDKLLEEYPDQYVEPLKKYWLQLASKARDLVLTRFDDKALRLKKDEFKILTVGLRFLKNKGVLKNL